MSDTTGKKGFCKKSEYKEKFVLRQRIAILILLTGLTAFLGFQIKHIQMPEDPLKAMFPSGHIFIPALDAIKKMVPEPRILVAIVEVKKGDIYTPDTIRKIDAVTRGLMRIKGVIPSEITSLTTGINHLNNSVEGLSPEPILGSTWPETPQEFESLKRKIAVNAMGAGRYVSYDNTAVMITAKLMDIRQSIKMSYEQLPDDEKSGILFKQYENRQIEAFNASLLEGIRELKKQEDDLTHTLYFMGAEVLIAQMTEMGKRDMPAAGIAMLLLTAFLLTLYFRTFLGVFIPVITMVVSIIWSLGLLSAFRIDLNPMAILFPLLSGFFSLGYSVLALKEYYRLYGITNDKHKAITAAFGSTPLTLSMVTAGLVMFSMYSVKVPMVKDLGLFSLFWLMGTFASVNIMNPICISFFPGPRGSMKPGDEKGVRWLARLIVSLSTGRRLYMMIVVLISVIAAGGVAVTKLDVGANIPGASFIRPDHPWNQCLKLMETKFMGPNQLLVYVQAKHKGSLMEPEAVNAISDFSDFLKDECGARDSIAFDMMVKLTRATLMDGNPKWMVVPDTREQVEGLANMIMMQGGVDDFMDRTFTEATISPFFPENDARHIDKYANGIQAYIDSHPSDNLEFSLGGGLLGMTKIINDGVREAYPIVIIAAFISAVILGMLATKSLLRGVTVVLPMAFAQAVVWLWMAVSGIPVSMSIVPVSAMVTGFGSLFGYYLISRFSMADAKLYDESSFMNEIRHAVGAVMFIGVLLFIAVLPWSFTGMKFQGDMAMMLGMTAALESLACVMFIPVLFRLLKRGY